MQTANMIAATAILGWGMSVSLLTAQTFTGSSSGGFTRSTTPANSVQPNPAAIQRENLRTADNRPLGAAVPNAESSSRAAAPLAPIAVAQGQPNLGKITTGTGTLPNESGQIWREYDLSPYTSRVKGVEKPEQAIVDWILRETGTDLWFSTPLGILNADKNTLRVYHTPQVQETVKGIYDRFLSNSAAANRLGIRIITVNSPNWRTRALPITKPIDVKSSGVDAWIMTRENAVRLLNDLKQRADMKEHSAGVVDLTNGQTTPLGLTRPRSYVKTIRPRPEVLPSYEPQMATIEEGYALSLSSLASADGSTLDLVVKCSIDQIERLIEVPIDIPSPLGPAQRVSIQVPQLVSWRLHERFRWGVDHVLLLSCGVVATPGAEKPAMPLLGGLVGNSRADALLFIDPLIATTPLAPPPGVVPFAANGAEVGNPLSTRTTTFGAPPHAPWGANSTTSTSPRFMASPVLPPSSHGLR